MVTTDFCQVQPSYVQDTMDQVEDRTYCFGKLYFASLFTGHEEKILITLVLYLGRNYSMIRESMLGSDVKRCTEYPIG